MDEEWLKMYYRILGYTEKRITQMLRTGKVLEAAKNLKLGRKKEYEKEDGTI